MKLLLSTLILMAASVMIGCDDPTDVRGSQETFKRRVVVIVDPTIAFPTNASSDQPSTFSEVLSRLRDFSATVPHSTQLDFWVMGEGTAAQFPVLAGEFFEHIGTINGPELHRSKLQAFFQNQVAPGLTAAWEEAHRNNRQPTSCIRSVLYAMSKDLEENGASFTQNYYVIVSDLLEACSEWDTTLVNFENELSVLPAPEGVTINLSGLSGLIIARQPHRRYTTAQQISALETTWADYLLQYCALKTDDFAITTSIPRSWNQIAN